MNDQTYTLALDHITVVAKTLETGVSYVRDQLGIDVPMGGTHPAMGTHNCLMKIGKGEFLEIIAVHPDMAHPKRPRWFGLDRPLLQDAVLATWVLGTNDIRAQTNPSYPEVGEATQLTRDSLEWLISVAPDGDLPMNGAFPTLVEWSRDLKEHPAEDMRDLRCSLASLTIKHPKIERVSKFLKDKLHDPRIHLEHGTSVELVADFQTPFGQRELR